MKRLKTLLVLIVAMAMVLSGTALSVSEYIKTNDGQTILVRTVDNYNPQGNYLHSDKNRIENKSNVILDQDGIPMVKYSWGTHYNPVTIAQYGLQQHALYLVNNDENHYNILIKVSNYLIDNQDEKGGWPFGFDHTFYKGRTELIQSPWYSALAQGQALSLLTRVYHLTGEQKYLDAAKKGVLLYCVPVEFGGVLRKFKNEYWFYEEYPTEPASYVLNGFIYSLFGLYDVYNVDGDETAKKLYLEGIRTLKHMLSLYDLGNRTSYDLTHYTTEGNPPNVARWGYHSTHILLLSGISSIETDESLFSITLERWIDYVKGIPTRTN